MIYASYHYYLSMIPQHNDGYPPEKQKEVVLFTISTVVVVRRM